MKKTILFLLISFLLISNANGEEGIIKPEQVKNYKYRICDSTLLTFCTYYTEEEYQKYKKIEEKEEEERIKRGITIFIIYIFIFYFYNKRQKGKQSIMKK